MKNKNGFTLVELLVTVVILGIITGLSIPLIRNIQENNKNREYIAYMDSLKYSAKLYVDSYGEDLFGRHKSGCSLIKYSDMMNKGLLKDIPVDKVSCNSGETFVKVVKMDDKYGYAASIGCGNVDASGKVSVDIKLPKTGLSSSDVCSVDAKTIMSFTAKPSADSSIKYKKRNVKLTISSDTGINDNMNIYYGYSYNKDSNVINNDWKKLPVVIPGKSKQKEDIYDGKTISITTDDLTSPNSVTGELYLVIQIEKLENLTTDSWTTDPSQDKFLYFGPYTVDNIKPKFNNSTVISSETGFNSIKPKLQLKVTDEKYSTVNDLRMCISYDTDSCSTKVSDIRNNSKYEKYDANKVLPAIQNGYNSSTHTVYVTVADAAGNYEKANYSYRIARRWTLTYDSNNGNACSPTTKSVTFNDWEKDSTWGTLCTPTRTNYTFTGWNTKKDGSGESVTSTTKATKNLTVYAQWRKNKVIFQFKVLDGGSLTARTTGANGTVNNWTKDSNNYIYLNGTIYRYSINYDATAMDLANYNNSSYLNITRTGYHGEADNEWICINGCKTANQKFAHKSISITPSNICDYSKADCVVDLKVNWIINTYTLSYNSNGGNACNPASVSKNHNQEWGTLCAPTRNNYKFLSWNTSANGSGTTVNSTTKALNDVTVYAQWEATYTADFHYTGKFKVAANGRIREDEDYHTKSEDYTIWFLTSGTLTSYINSNIKAFLVAGGAQADGSTGGKGGGWKNQNASLVKDSTYRIHIGGNNGNTTAFGAEAVSGEGKDGTQGVYLVSTECPLNNYSMYRGYGWGKVGVYAWNDSSIDGVRYGCGGTGGDTCCGMTCCGTTCNGTGGAHDEGCGDGNGWGNTHDGVENTGGGGGGAGWRTGEGKGGSGIVIIRKR